MPHTLSAPRRPGLLSWATTLAIVAAGGAALASPAPEYGPEAEAVFLQRCEASRGMNTAECRRLMERLQSSLGYEAFLGQADRGAEAFPRQTQDLLARRN